MVGQGTPVQIINVVFAKNQRNVQYNWASIPRKIQDHSKCHAKFCGYKGSNDEKYLHPPMISLSYTSLL